MIRPATWKAQFDLLTWDEVRTIHEATLQVMEQTGLLMPLSKKRQDQAQDEGLRIDRNSDRVYFPPAVVEAALKKAPAGFSLFARDPVNDIALDRRHGYLSLDGSVTEIMDLESGQVRPSSKSDLEDVSRVADALPEISFLWPGVCARDCPPRTQPLHELATLLTRSSKHVQAMTAVDPLNAQGSVDMAAEIAGGKRELRDRPIISNFQCSISPLSYEGKSLEAAFIFAGAGVPTGFVVMTIGCATAPATVAGNIVVTNAEALAGIVLLELFFPGAPTFYGSCGTMMELRNGGVVCSGPEDLLFQAAGCQLARFYGLPSSIGTFATGANQSDWQAGVDNGLSAAISLFCRADMMSGAGLLASARIFSLEQLLLDCETFELVRRVARGFEVNEITLALETIQEVGPRSHFMAADHTRAHLREIWQPNLMLRGSWEDWVRSGRPSAADKAKERVKAILSSHQPEPLRCEDRIREILKAYDKMG